MAVYDKLKKLSCSVDFRNYVCAVFIELKEKANITFEEIVDWLWHPMNDKNIATIYRVYQKKDNFRLYDFHWPCSIVPFRNRYSFLSFDCSESLVQINNSIDHNTINVVSYVVDGEWFSIFDFIHCLSENFVGTYDTFKTILVNVYDG